MDEDDNVEKEVAGKETEEEPKETEEETKETESSVPEIVKTQKRKFEETVDEEEKEADIESDHAVKKTKTSEDDRQDEEEKSEDMEVEMGEAAPEKDEIPKGSESSDSNEEVRLERADTVPLEADAPKVEETTSIAVPDVTPAVDEDGDVATSSSVAAESETALVITDEAAAPTAAEQESSAPVADGVDDLPDDISVELDFDADSAAAVKEPVENGYIMIDMDDVPPPDSVDVLQAAPAGAHPETGTVSSADAVTTTPAGAAISNGLNKEDQMEIVLQREFATNPLGSGHAEPSKTFTVVSYNILADFHAQKDYTGSSALWITPDHLSIGYRHKLLMRELLYLDGDIVCLQEVGADYFNDVLRPAMEG